MPNLAPTTMFIVVLTADALALASLLVSIMRPSRRIWPPPGRASWQFWWLWALTLVVWLGLHALAILDWNTWFYPHPARLWIGGALLLAGTILALWGVHAVGVHNSLGLKGELVTRGPYRFTRNPQYLGDIAILVGLAILANSELVALATLPALLLPILAPYAEEPWLEARFGAPYRHYLQSTPRFI